MADFRFTYYGSITAVDALSPAAVDFAEENFQVADWQGEPRSFKTDWRPSHALAERLLSEGWDVVWRV